MDIVTKETFKAKVQKLVEHFSDNEEYYKSKEYKEDHLRQEFINPFFKALGWDMDNEQGFAPQYREVIHEDRIEIEGKPKAPDYAFKVGSDRKFFVEAKASSVKVFSEIDPAFQLRRYAWSGQLPVSILTDFEEFSIYDTTIEPKHTDKSSVARVKYIHYKDYIKEADYLWDTFSKEAVWKGSFDKFAKRVKKGSQLVDKSFLKEIELWRDLVAKDVASNNNLNIYELNSVVQKFIDRIIFLRIAEDRGVESYETLRGAVKSPDTYSQLLKIFSRADEKYNSSLFDLKKDELSTKIKISDKTLDRILNNLYYPKSPYEFSVIGVDILGSVYEQFLGKVIRLTKGGNAVIEEKPEVKKAGGVYYTPQYIVDYIVKNTVGELVEGKTPKDVAKLKIVDPACGSGSFLIGAYNYLLNWHHKYYVENDVEKNLKAKKLFKDGEGNYFLSTQEKKDILLNNIHGVDIDPQAVEVTKLSFALKMLEGENSETINAQYKLFADRILPDLSTNIKCGNSLIGSDYYSDKQITLLGDEELRKVNAFDWDKEFPFIFRYGGFDAVIGNPPYGAELTQNERNYLSIKYDSTNLDTAVLFMVLASKLLKKDGRNSFIIPKAFTYASNWEDIRRILLPEISKIVDCSKVWTNVKLEMIIYLLTKGQSLKSYETFRREDNTIAKVGDINKDISNKFGFIINGISSKELKFGLKILSNERRLNDFVFNQRGAIIQNELSSNGELPVIGGKNIQRYFSNSIVKGYIGKSKEIDDKAYIKTDSILVQRLVAHITNPRPHIKISAITSEFVFPKKSLIVDTINQLQNNSEVSSYVLCGIINSKLISWYCYKFIFANAIRTMQFDNPTTSRIPIPEIDVESRLYKDIDTSVKSILELRKSIMQNEQTGVQTKDLSQRLTYLEHTTEENILTLYGFNEEEKRDVMTYL